MVNRGSHGAIVLEQWGEKGGKGTRRESEEIYTAGLWPASRAGGSTFTLRHWITLQIQRKQASWSECHVVVNLNL